MLGDRLVTSAFVIGFASPSGGGNRGIGAFFFSSCVGTEPTPPSAGALSGPGRGLWAMSGMGGLFCWHFTCGFSFRRGALPSEVYLDDKLY